MNIQMKRYTGQGLGGSQTQELLSLWNWDLSPSQYVDVFTNVEALPTPYCWDFNGGFIM